MEFESVVKERRSIRRFKDKEVLDDDISKLIESARLCQSAKNRQPWRFMILKGNEKDKISDIMIDLFKDKDVELPGYMNSSKVTARIIKSASVLILVLKEKDDNWTTGDLVSIGAAIEHICLEAVNLGLGSLWIRDTVYTEGEILEYIGYKDLDLVSAVAIGYADESPSPRPRKSLEDIVINKR